MNDSLKERLKKTRLGRELRSAVHAARVRRARARAVKRSAPPILHIEPTAACNLKCTMCFRTTHQFSAAPMDFDLYDRIVHQAARFGVQTLRLYLRGEPLLHPRIADMVSTAKSLKIPHVEMNTNGQLLNSALSESLLEAGLDRILFSVEGFQKHTYENIRRGGSFERLALNMQTFRELRDTASARTRMEIITVNMPDNPVPNPDFNGFWSPLVDSIQVVGMVLHGGLDQGPRAGCAPVAAPCAMLWDRLAVLSDGAVPLCCVDIDASIRLGNLQDSTLEEIWQSPALRRIRAAHMRGRRASMPLCAACSYMDPGDSPA